MAIFWSLAVSMCVIMEGFDSILVPNFYAFPTFQRKCMAHRLCASTSHKADVAQMATSSELPIRQSLAINSAPRGWLS
jgi:hypothetical protein